MSVARGTTHPRRRRSVGNGGTLLEAVPLFSGMAGQERRMVERLGTRVRVGPGRVLITAGERGAETFIVLRGFASCVVGGTEVALFGSGDIFGEVAVLDGGPRTATVVAETEMELVVLSIDEFDALIHTSPTVARRMLRTLGGRLRLANGAVRE